MLSYFAEANIGTYVHVHDGEERSMDKDILVSPNITIKEALKKLDKTAEKVLIVVNKDNVLSGALTDGDIRRSLLNGFDLEKTIEGVYNPRPIFIRELDFEIESVRRLMTEKAIDVVPVVNCNGVVIDYLSWSHVFGEISSKRGKNGSIIDIPVIIMAGGKGTRLEPFTKVLPKPLIPLGDVPILERIMDEFSFFGVKDFYLTLNYKGEMIEAYTNSLSKNYNIHLLWEEESLGTAGSIKMISDHQFENVIVSNCDILVKADYPDALAHHRENNSHITVLSSIQYYKIPYGVIDYVNGGKVTGIREKPEYTFVINTGVYILKRECLKYIPDKTKFDMPTLINDLIADNKVVCNYPVNESDYVDIGQWCEYWKEMEKTMMK